MGLFKSAILLCLFGVAWLLRKPVSDVARDALAYANCFGAACQIRNMIFKAYFGPLGSKLAGTLVIERLFCRFWRGSKNANGARLLKLRTARRCAYPGHHGHRGRCPSGLHATLQRRTDQGWANIRLPLPSGAYIQGRDGGLGGLRK
jgi:hypothetical protein